MNKEAYELGVSAALAEKLGQVPAILRTTLRHKPSLLARIKQLFAGARKAAPGSVPAKREVGQRVFVDKYLYPGRPTTWRTPSGGMTRAPEGKAVVETLKPLPAPPGGTHWTQSAEGQRLIATPREPLVYAPTKPGMPKALSERFEGWGF